MGPKTDPSRIILIEDNPGDIFLVKEALRMQHLDFELVSYTSAQEALEGMAGPVGELPDAILLDLNLGGDDGMNVLWRLRNLPKLAGVPTAVITSSRSPRDKERAMRLGVNAYIEKPSQLDAFMTEVGSAIRGLLARSTRT
jgi:CheY-like chemotaxis protein